MRTVFYSFHFKRDVARAARIRRIGDVEGNPQEPDSRWAVVQRGGDPAISAWIDEQMAGMSCLIVLIGAETADRRWVEYEIRRSWALNKGILGVYVHRLVDADGLQSEKGINPFADLVIDGARISDVVPAYDPPVETSDEVFAYIATHMADWVEHAIALADRRRQLVN
jgi:hypothetical protein